VRAGLHFAVEFLYQAGNLRAQSAASSKEHAMRPEAEKLALSIRQSLALLRRHL
jgi:hypothetical protein